MTDLKKILNELVSIKESAMNSEGYRFAVMKKAEFDLLTPSECSDCFVNISYDLVTLVHNISELGGIIEFLAKYDDTCKS